MYGREFCSIFFTAETTPRRPFHGQDGASSRLGFLLQYDSPPRQTAEGTTADCMHFFNLLDKWTVTTTLKGINSVRQDQTKVHQDSHCHTTLLIRQGYKSCKL